MARTVLTRLARVSELRASGGSAHSTIRHDLKGIIRSRRSSSLTTDQATGHMILSHVWKKRWEAELNSYQIAHIASPRRHSFSMTTRIGGDNRKGACGGYPSRLHSLDRSMRPPTLHAAVLTSHAIALQRFCGTSDPWLRPNSPPHASAVGKWWTCWAAILVFGSAEGSFVLRPVWPEWY